VILRGAPTALLGAIALAGCGPAALDSPTPASGPPCSEPRFAIGRTSTQCGELVDAEGRVVYLHGVNARVKGVFDVTFDDGRAPLEPIPDFTADDARRARAMGFDALRLPVNWSGLVPVEGKGLSEPYVARVIEVLDVAKAAGLRTLVDLHQDAFSKEIGEDGAPLWAIVPKPTKLLGGPLDDLGDRRKSAQVLAAFDTFFGDSADGARLRTALATALHDLAARLVGRDDVVGIELFNEPISDPEHLDRLHDELQAAVRAADPGRLVFFEPDSLRNTSDHAPLAQRAPWPGSVYAPHVYTYAFSAPPGAREGLTKDALAPSNEAARDEADSWKAPLAITEYGYGPGDPHADDYYAWQVAAQDAVRASAFVWLWKEESQGSWGLFDHDAATGAWTERAHLRKALAKVAPEAIAGWPVRFGYDPAALVFELVFDADANVTAPTRLHVPQAEDFAATFEVTCDGAKVGASRDPETGAVDVPCSGAGRHTITVVGQR
jgi:endoglycosylceramidase